MATPERLFGLVGADTLYFDPASVWENDIEPYFDLVPGETEIPVEEYTVMDDEKNVPTAAHIIEWVCEWTADNDYAFDPFNDMDMTKDAELLALAENLREAVASKITYHQADKLVATHILRVNKDGEPMWGDKPIYQPKVEQTRKCATCGCDCYYCQGGHGDPQGLCCFGHASFCCKSISASAAKGAHAHA